MTCFPRHRDRDQGGPLVPVFEAVTGPDQPASARTFHDINPTLVHPFEQFGVLEDNRPRADAVVGDSLIEDEGVEGFFAKPGSGVREPTWLNPEALQAALQVLHQA